jgi:hypothetical protein
MAQRAFGDDRRLRHDVGTRLEVGERLAVAVAALVARAHTDDDAVLDEQLLRRGLGQDVDAGLLGLVGEEAPQLRDGDHVVAVVAEVGRHRLQRQRLLFRQQVDRVLVDLPQCGPLGLVHVREQLLHCRGPHVGAREQVRAGRLALLDHGHRYLAQLLRQLRLVLQQLRQPDRAGQPGGAAPHDRHADLDALVLGVGRWADELLRWVDRRRELGRRYTTHRRATRPSSPSRPRSAWA